MLSFNNRKMRCLRSKARLRTELSSLALRVIVGCLLAPARSEGMTHKRLRWMTAGRERMVRTLLTGSKTVKGGLERECNTAPGKLREGNTNLSYLELKPDDRRSTVRLAREKSSSNLDFSGEGGHKQMRGDARICPLADS